MNVYLLLRRTVYTNHKCVIEEPELEFLQSAIPVEIHQKKILGKVFEQNRKRPYIPSLLTTDVSPLLKNANLENPATCYCFESCKEVNIASLPHWFYLRAERTRLCKRCRCFRSFAEAIVNDEPWFHLGR